MKKLVKILVFISLVFIFNLSIVKANNISKMSMDIYVNNSGTAHVKETWVANLSSGSEGYKPYYNLGNSNIENFIVTEGSKIYKNIGTWNLNASFNDKAYKNGINNISNGVELCWGISSYGSHTYILEYDITNFVAKTDDSDIIYWTLIPYNLSSKPGSVYIKIYSDQPYDSNLPVWGYGNYGGYAYVYDGYIEMDSNGQLNSSEYMTILVKFPLGTFNLENNYVGHNFDYYYNMAEEGAVNYTDDTDSSSNNIYFLVGFIIFAWFAIVLLSSKVNVKSNKSGNYNLYFGATGRKIPKDLDYFRDIPCNKDIYRAYWVASNYSLMNQQTDFFGTVMLKWLKEGKISIKKEESKNIFIKEQTSIVFNKNFSFDIEIEEKLFNMMYGASIDGVLEPKEFEKWCKDQYKKIFNWFNNVLDYQNVKLIEEGKITKDTRPVFGRIISNNYDVDPSMMEEAKQMKGLKNFLKDFSNIKERESKEVLLWQEYLMYAQLFGIAEKVAKEFKKLYPDVINDVSYNDILFIYTFSHSGISSASSAKSRAESYSSGGGGFSSGGGGGGSFGGGGGGGGFR